MREAGFGNLFLHFFSSLREEILAGFIGVTPLKMSVLTIFMGDFDTYYRIKP